MLSDPGKSAEFAIWLADAGLTPFTLNGFPYGDFHEPIVKHRVYQPTWFEPSRLLYTRDLICILHSLLPPSMEGSISTLPIAWNRPQPDPEQLQLAAAHLREVADVSADLEAETGRLIYLCLEPEPGCVLQVADDVVRFFDEFLIPRGDEQRVPRHLRVCHDICHTAVMFEEQQDVFSTYAEHGIRVGKVQVSSAVRIDFQSITQPQQEMALEQLASFAEDRYLHQTMVWAPDTQQTSFFDDLPGEAIESMRRASREGLLQSECRVHFHVPIFLDRFGAIATTQGQIRECIRAANHYPELTHFEVETYAWSVLPRELQRGELADGIAREMNWLVNLPEFQGVE